MTDPSMICPRCGGSMTTFSRASVQVDQCDNCKGIFLDRGEIEQLVQAEANYYQQQPPPPGYQQPAYQQPGYQQPGYQQSRYYDDDDHHGDEHHGGGHGSRRSFLHELF